MRHDGILRRQFLGLFSAMSTSSLLTRQASAGEAVLRLGGTGGGLGLQKILVEAYRVSAPQIDAKILPSLGSAGGIRALAEGALDLAFSGRPLTAEETKLGLVQRRLLRSPLVIITSNKNVSSVTNDELAKYFANVLHAWPDGSPVRVILRPKSEVSFQVLGERFANIAAAIELARRRPELPVATTDQQNFSLAETLSGSLALGLLTQVKTEPGRFYPIQLDGVEPTLANLRSGKYACSCDFHVITRSDAAQPVANFAAFIHSSRGRDILQQFGGDPV
jgi:phosphate transport system substrate-binding protein